MCDPRLQKLADLLVNYSVGVRGGQLVRVRGPAFAEPLLLEIYRAVLAAGAHPLLRLGCEAAEEILLKHGSDGQLRYQHPLTLPEVQSIDASIDLWAEENTKALSQCDPAHLAAHQSARRPMMDLFMRRSAAGQLKWVGTQYPCQASAQDAEMSLADYEQFVFAAGHLDEVDPAARWRQISQRQQYLADFMQGKKEMRIVAANGTDLRLGIEGRRWVNCDGHENFPDGEVFSGPLLDSAQGRIRFSFPAVHNGREVQDVDLTFRDGKVVKASAGKNQEYLLAMLDMDAGSRLLGECAMGTNYHITRFTRNTLFDEKIGGTCHVALGAGYPETGNDNSSGLHWDMVVDLRQGGRIEVDGEIINVDGRFTNARWPGNG